MLDSSKPGKPIQATPRLKATKSERTRAAILDAALEFLWEKPFRDLTVGKLMSGLDVGRSTFYQYFRDVHELMEILLQELEAEILSVANPWFSGEAESVEALRLALSELVRVCHAHGPLIRAVTDAAVNDPRVEKAWNNFLGDFDQAVAARIETEQAIGKIPQFDAMQVAKAFNRMDAYLFVMEFGRHPRNPPGPVLDAITQIWISTLYPQASPKVSGTGE